MTKSCLAILFLLWAVLSPLSPQTVADSLVRLQGVEIRGTHFGGISGGEIKRLQAEHNLSSFPATAADALRQIPSLSTDIEGNITFRGSGKTAALLNGVPYGLLEEYSGDMLIQLPAAFFNRMEIVSAPPVEWIPDGDAGVLNLSSSGTAQDSPLRVTLGAGLYGRYNAGAAMNLHPGKFRVLARYNYRWEYRTRSYNRTTTTAAGTTAMNNNASAYPGTHLADLELGYDPGANDRLTLHGLYYLMDYSRYAKIGNTRLDPQGEVLNRILRHRRNNQQQDAYAAEARWKHSFDCPDNFLAFTLNYNNFVYDEDNDFQNENPQTNAITAQDNLFIRRRKDNLYWAANYHRAMERGLLLKAGYVGRYRKEKHLSEANSLMNGEWTPNAQRADNYDFDRLINLMYASVEKTWRNISAEAGLQAEHSIRKAGGTVGEAFLLYPRVSFSLRADACNNFGLNYRQRVVRPSGAELNRFIDYSDATYVVQGNPDLMNEIIHTVELTHRLSLPAFRLSPALYYRHRDNRIMDVLTGDGQVWQKQNAGTGRQFGAEVSGAWSAFRFLTVSLSGNIFHDEIDGRAMGYGARKSMICRDAKGAVNIRLAADTELQIDGYFISDRLTPQGRILSRSTLNAGLSQYLWERKLRLNLSLNNLFDTLGETTLIDTEALKMRQVRNRDARVVWLAVSCEL
jgi:hypothetical protein